MEELAPLLYGKTWVEASSQPSNLCDGIGLEEAEYIAQDKPHGEAVTKTRKARFSVRYTMQFQSVKKRFSHTFFKIN